ncbi:MAG: response regulator [Candidatus Woesearchaeota archaeon]|nr:response regulator [Candidatus Woesearchaeota archaeon]
MTEMTRILLVEDNEQYAQAAEHYLTSKGTAVVRAKDYSEAIARLSGSSPDLDRVITDCFFPEITGSGKTDLGKEVVNRIANPDDVRDDYKPYTESYRRNLIGAIGKSEENQPLGILVAERAVELGLPLVLTTSTYHHDELTQPIYEYADLSRRWRLIDCGRNSQDDKANPKFWEHTLISLESKAKSMGIDNQLEALLNGRDS